MTAGHNRGNCRVLPIVKRTLDFFPLVRILNHMLKQSDALDTMFHALADPTRRQLVERLSRGPASVSELASPLAMSMPAVMQHIAVLEAGGIIRTKKTGRVRSCELRESALTEAEAWIQDRRLVWEQRLDRLGALLEAEMLKETNND